MEPVVMTVGKLPYFWLTAGQDLWKPGSGGQKIGIPLQLAGGIGLGQRDSRQVTHVRDRELLPNVTRRVDPDRGRSVPFQTGMDGVALLRRDPESVQEDV